jgi:hypothetical protein
MKCPPIQFPQLAGCCALNVEFNISYPILIKISYFILPTERRVWGKGGPKTG